MNGIFLYTESDMPHIVNIRGMIKYDIKVSLIHCHVPETKK